MKVVHQGFAMVVGVALLLAAGWALWPTSSVLTRVHDEVGVRSAAPTDAPNVVLVMLCTFRMDRTSLRDPALNTTPWLESAARRGVWFDSTIASAPWTRPAAISLLAGRHAISLGMVEPGPSRNKRALPTDVPTLAQSFRAAGWHTIGASANPNLASHYGMTTGFDAYFEPSLRWHEGGPKVLGDTVVDHVLAELDRTPRDGPLFVQVMLIDAHSPRQARWWDVSHPGPPAVRDYDAALTQQDRVLARMADLLAERGLTEQNTVFVLVSDHGEGLNFPDTLGAGHGRQLRPAVLDALWVMYGAGVGQDVQVSGLTSQVDVAPTVLALAGLAPFSGPGLDLSEVSAGGGHTRRAQAFSDTWFLNENRAAVFTDSMGCERTYGVPGTSVQCFDRRTPGGAAEPIQPGLVRALDQWRTRQIAEGVGAPGVEIVTEEPELERHLEALGYVEGD